MGGRGTNDATTTAPSNAVTDPSILVPAPGPAPVRRLTNLEYIRSIQELTKIDINGAQFESYNEPIASALLDDGAVNGFAGNVDALGMDFWNVYAYQSVAEEVAKQTVNDATKRTTLFGSACASTSVASQTCLSHFIETFGRKSFRRPLGQDEVTRFTALGAAVYQDQPYGSYRAVIEAMLQAPQFYSDSR